MAFYKQQRNLLTKIGQLGKNSLKVNLQRLDKVATGGTANSIDFRIDFTEKKSSVSVVANEAIIFIDAGRKPGSKQPPPKPIEDWVSQKGIKFFDKKNRPLPVKVIAFLIGRAIARDGIKPTNVLSDTFTSDSFRNSIAKSIRKAALEDITVNLSESFKKI